MTDRRQVKDDVRTEALVHDPAIAPGIRVPEAKGLKMGWWREILHRLDTLNVMRANPVDVARINDAGADLATAQVTGEIFSILV